MRCTADLGKWNERGTKAGVDSGIVVGADGSPSSNAAIRWAARDAAMRNVSLDIVHAVAPLIGAWVATPVPTGVLEWQHELGRQILDDAMQTAEESTNGSLHVTTQLRTTATVPALVGLSKGAKMSPWDVAAGVLSRAPCWGRSAWDWFIMRTARGRNP